MTVCLCPKRASTCQRATNMALSFGCLRVGPLDQPSFIPSLDHGLPCYLAGLELDHGRAIDLRSVRVGAALREGEPVAVSDAGLDLVRHGTAANVVMEGC